MEAGAYKRVMRKRNKESHCYYMDTMMGLMKKGGERFFVVPFMMYMETIGYTIRKFPCHGCRECAACERELFRIVQFGRDTCKTYSAISPRPITFGILTECASLPTSDRFAVNYPKVMGYIANM